MIDINHALLPNIRTATLAERYQAAQAALKQCNSVDECKTWADKSAALASYAKQSENKELEHLAMRIRARAVSRCGELLREFDAKAHRGKKGVSAAAHLSGRDQAAEERKNGYH